MPCPSASGEGRREMDDQRVVLGPRPSGVPTEWCENLLPQPHEGPTDAAFAGAKMDAAIPDTRGGKSVQMPEDHLVAGPYAVRSGDESAWTTVEDRTQRGSASDRGTCDMASPSEVRLRSRGSIGGLRLPAHEEPSKGTR
jgi:hypothetical protein